MYEVSTLSHEPTHVIIATAPLERLAVLVRLQPPTRTSGGSLCSAVLTRRPANFKQARSACLRHALGHSLAQ